MTTLETLFGWVCTASLRASIIALIVLLFRRLCSSQLTANWRYALWFPVLVVLLVPAQPVLPGWLSLPLDLLEIGQEPRAFHELSADAKRSSKAVLQNSFGHDALSDELSKRESNVSLAASGGAVESFSAVRLSAILSGIWGAGVLVFSTFVVVSYHLALRQVRHLAQHVDEHLLARIAAAATAVRLRQLPVVLNSAAVKSPAVCGIFKPILLLNVQQLRQLTNEEVDLVLAHELTHIRRGDLWLNSLLCLLLAVHWFNPMLWFVFFSVRDDREAVCDDDVLQGLETSRRIVYGNALLKLETDKTLQLSLPFVGMILSQSRLKERIHMIAHNRRTGVVMNAMLILLVSLLTFLGIARADDPQQQPPHEAKDQDSAAQTSTVASGDSDAADSSSGWGAIAEFSGLRSRLTLQSETTTIGKPLRFRLEVKNFGNRVTGIDPQNYAPYRVLRADFADERPGGAPFIGTKVQTAAAPVALKPGESVVLWEQVDLNDLFLLKDVDTYDVYAEGGEWAMQTTWRDSNRIRITLAPGKLQIEQQLLAELYPILPNDWRLSRSFGDIFFHFSPSDLREDSIAMQLLFRDMAMVEQLEKQFATESTAVLRLGKTLWGEALLVIPNEATEHWTNARESIPRVLQKFVAKQP